MAKILGNREKGQLFVVSAPAGTGKSTLVKMVREEFPGSVVQSCSWTTRQARAGEVDKVDYHFVSIEEFEEKIEANEFLEYANVFGNYYGTSQQEVNGWQDQGKHVVLVIDTQGAMKVKQSGAHATFIFIEPPSTEELKRRLFKRRTEDESMIEKRLEWAARELEMKKYYDYHVINDNLEITYQVLRSIFIAEEHKN